MQGFAEFSEEKKIIVKTKMGGEIPATIKVTGKDYHIVKADASGKQYKVDHQGNSLEEEIADKDLPFTPDAKKTKPSTPGKYGSAYSTVRNLARKALEKQKQVKEKISVTEELEEAFINARDYASQGVIHPTHAKGHKVGNETDFYAHGTGDKLSGKVIKNTGKEVHFQADKIHGGKVHKFTVSSHLPKPVNEETLDEKSAQARANKARKNVMDAGRGAAYRQRTGVNLDPKTDGYPSQQALNKALGRFLRREEIEEELGEAAPVAPSVGVHRIGVTVSDPGHTAVSKRNEKLQKFVKVTAHSKENAVEQGKKFYAKKGWKVHGAEHAGMVHEEVEMDEGYRGNSEIDKPFFAAQDHKTAAEKARKEKDAFSYHMHMASHHDSMAQWNSSKGRHHVADQHMNKAEQHEHDAQQARKGAK